MRNHTTSRHTWILESDFRRNHWGIGLNNQADQKNLPLKECEDGSSPVLAAGLSKDALCSESLLGRLRKRYIFNVQRVFLVQKV